MSNEQDGDHSRTRSLKQRWDEEDAARDKLQRRAKELFLEEQGKQIFAPIEEYLTRVDNVLRGFGASVYINPTWEHLDDQRLRRVAKVRSTQPDQQLSLDFEIHGARIFHRDRSYQSSRDAETLVRVIAEQIEQLLKPR
jgi:hypothetical protein